MRQSPESPPSRRNEAPTGTPAPALESLSTITMAKRMAPRCSARDCSVLRNMAGRWKVGMQTIASGARKARSLDTQLAPIASNEGVSTGLRTSSMGTCRQEFVCLTLVPPDLAEWLCAKSRDAGLYSLSEVSILLRSLMKFRGQRLARSATNRGALFCQTGSNGCKRLSCSRQPALGERIGDRHRGDASASHAIERPLKKTLGATERARRSRNIVREQDQPAVLRDRRVEI